jgi:hypothetical protein
VQELQLRLRLSDDGIVVGTWDHPDEPPVELLDLISGTWACQQVESLQALSNRTPNIEFALDFAAIRGLSGRYPWRAFSDGDTFDFSLVEQTKQLADEHGVAFSWRPMAGRHCPTKLLDNVRTYTDGTNRFPAPFEADSSPALAFESYFAAMLDAAVDWSRQNGVTLLHLPWHGHDWAELWHGKDVQALPGYSLDTFVTGCTRLVDLALARQGDDIIVEFPLTGHGALSGEQGASNRIASHIVETAGADSPRVFVQANGWGQLLDGLDPPENVGEWGNPNPDTERAFDCVWAQPIRRGLQMIQPYDYANWPDIFADLRRVGAWYAEVYCGESFEGPHASELATCIVEFAGQVS